MPSWPASGQPQIGPLVLPSRRNGCAVAARTFSVEQLQSERRIYDPFLIVSCADESYYIEIWGESEFERQHTSKTSGRSFLILLHHKHVYTDLVGGKSDTAWQGIRAAV